MLFVSLVHSHPGKFEETVRALKRLHVPENIKIREFVGLFGDPDAVIIFEAGDEKSLSNCRRMGTMSLQLMPIGTVSDYDIRLWQLNSI